MAAWPDRRTQTTTTRLSALELQRERLVARLRTECTEGRISLDRFSDLVGDVYAARSVAEVEALRERLVPAAVAPLDPPPRPARTAPGRRWVVAVFGQSVKKGRFRLDDETAVLAVFGDCVVDLTDATIAAGEQAMTAVSLFGSITVVVPDGVEVAVEGASVFGSRRSDVDATASAGGPVLVVRAWACFGDVRIRSTRRPRP